jgi:group II intron reverse transcriptase/maturase
MIQACDALDIIQEKNRRNPKWINRDLYRLLLNPTLHIMAYERVKSKPGNMTEGADGKTLDGFSIETIWEQIAKLRREQYHPIPVRRVYIPKEKGYRPLGVPSPLDKIVQECIRLILEAIYEPNFHENSHGFRPGRSCHTALESLRRNWVGTKWVLKLDIAECFERVDHHRLLDILREKIQDDRFINLIRKFLNAGYLENWMYHRTYSGTPQGSVISPILTNIYLDKLDQRLATICEQHSSGEYRKRNWRQIALMEKRKRLLEQGEADPSKRGELRGELWLLNQQILATPSADYHDLSYTRVKFLRYADDVAIGVIGPKTLAIQVKAEVVQFLEDELKLQVNEEKTCILHLPTEKAHFLGYEFKTAPPRLRRHNLRKKRSPHNVVQTTKVGSGNITLLVPLRKLSRKLKTYTANGQPASRFELTNQPADQIIERYNSVMRGWYNYYQLAENVAQLHYARYVLHYSLAKTLAHKEGVSMYKIFRKYGKDIAVTKPNGRIVCFFNEPLKQVKKAKSTWATVDVKPLEWPRKTRTRLLDRCAICDSGDQVVMHHVRHIRKRGQNIQGFTLYLAAINRKQIPVCKQCHRDIHNGKYDGQSLSSILEKIETATTGQGRYLDKRST